MVTHHSEEEKSGLAGLAPFISVYPGNYYVVRMFLPHFLVFSYLNDPFY